MVLFFFGRGGGGGVVEGLIGGDGWGVELEGLGLVEG